MTRSGWTRPPDGYRVFTRNTGNFPDVPGMLARLAGEGFRVITIVDPGVKHELGCRVHDQALERDVLCRTEGGDVYIGQVWPGNTTFPDFVAEEGRAWWGELNAAHVASGVAGIWNDMNEPATGAIDPGAMRFGRGAFSHERFHNQYALLMAMGTTQGLLAAMPDRRTFVLSRAGFAGIQRYAANWMGDNMSRWDHLWLSIAMGAGLGVSGQAFVGADIGVGHDWVVDFTNLEGRPMGAFVVTAVDATVDPAREAEFLEGYRQMIDADKPEGLVRSELLRGQGGAWRIQTTWRDLDTLLANRTSGKRPAALDLLERVGAEHSHTWFTVEQSYEG